MHAELDLTQIVQLETSVVNLSVAELGAIAGTIQD